MLLQIQATRFAITGAKLYVPVVNLSLKITQDYFNNQNQY